MIKVGDIVGFKTPLFARKTYTVLAIKRDYVTKLKSEQTKYSFTGLWDIDELTLIKSSLTNLKDKIEEKILYLDKKAEKLKLATLSKQTDVLSVPSLEETDRETTWQSTATGTHTVSLADIQRVRSYTIGLPEYLRALMVHQEA